MRLICYPELKKEIGSQGFKEEEDNSQENVKSKDLVHKYLSHCVAIYFGYKSYLW